MFGIIKKMFIILLSNIVNGSNHTECVSLRNQKCNDSTFSYDFTMNIVKNFTTIHLQLN